MMHPFEMWRDVIERVCVKLCIKSTIRFALGTEISVVKPQHIDLNKFVFRHSSRFREVNAYRSLRSPAGVS
jgi:hypothetical protein